MLLHVYCAQIGNKYKKQKYEFFLTEKTFFHIQVLIFVFFYQHMRMQSNRYPALLQSLARVLYKYSFSPLPIPTASYRFLPHSTD